VCPHQRQRLPLGKNRHHCSHSRRLEHCLRERTNGQTHKVCTCSMSNPYCSGTDNRLSKHRLLLIMRRTWSLSYRIHQWSNRGPHCTIPALRIWPDTFSPQCTYCSRIRSRIDTINLLSCLTSLHMDLCRIY